MKAKDEKGDSISVILVEVKTGKGKLSREESMIKKAVEEGRVSWETIFLRDEIAGDAGVSGDSAVLNE
ncbi:MAG TPA: Holliday junction resolvase-like protein [Methanoregula sp.]|nr:Holliday junction resolvase-like protein [Methanoregula sp.]